MKLPAMALLTLTVIYAQQAGKALVAPAEIRPDTVVATINGRKYTADEVRRIVAGTPAQAQAMFARDPRAFLREHAALMALVSYAEQNGLEKTSPYRETIEFYRIYVLSNAAVNYKRITIQVTPEEQKKYYETHPSEFRESRVRMIYVPFTDQKSEAEARAKAEAAVARARKGEDFSTLEKENAPQGSTPSGEFAVRTNSSQPPEHMKKVVLSAAGGTITDPLRHDNGYYIFRVESQNVLPYEKVRDEIYKEIQNARFRDWQQNLQSQSSVQIENEEFFNNVRAGK